MFTTFTKTTVLVATALTFGTASFADNTNSSATPQFESHELAQTVGMDRRQDRREDRRYDRNDRRDDRQSCRQGHGVGADKRNCKQAERQARNMNG
ncbi:hypothetical protein SAMN05444000_13013 [Shimia gijangensis]|uniref:Uncharacterized protein n=1 Tax=Shimia gijangensis TaxID=1470563 RepID=A0A1M6SK10_9RHOB|nr:hypothetical protein [Shimia gijangensis]SHK44997.1 hypothetical protein SAMN05444000_13013 [Shimia gijangensis]